MLVESPDVILMLVEFVALGLAIDFVYWRFVRTKGPARSLTGQAKQVVDWIEARWAKLDITLAGLQTRLRTRAAVTPDKGPGPASALAAAKAQTVVLASVAESEVLQRVEAVTPRPAHIDDGAALPLPQVQLQVESAGHEKPMPLDAEAPSIPTKIEVTATPGALPQASAVAVTVLTGESLSHVRVTLEVPVGVTLSLTVDARPPAPEVVVQSSQLTAPQRLAAPSAGASPAAAGALPPSSTVTSELAPATPVPATPALAKLAPANPLRLPQPRLSLGQLAFRRHLSSAAQWGQLALRRCLSTAPQWGQAAWQRLAASLVVKNLPLETALFGLGLVVYLITRLVGLDRYPIYFFSDEAVQSVAAANLVRNSFQNAYQEFLPSYFPLGPNFSLNSVSVYLQLLPYLVFGKSVFVTRATSVLVTLFGTAAVGLTLKDIFKVRYWWAAVLLLTVTPMWFLISRTAFGFAELTAFYAGFVYFYLRYRCLSPGSLYWAVVMGALTFYTHGLGQVLMAVTVALLLVVDLPYHIKQRDVVGRGFLLALLLVLPYLRYALAHGPEFTDQVYQRGAYWTDAGLTLLQRLQRFGDEYLFGLDPAYWYFPETRDLARQIMNGYGNLLWPTMPFAAIGLLLVFNNLRQAAYRVVGLTLLAVPVGSALVAISVWGVMGMVVPATILTTLGLAWVLEWLAKRWRWSPRVMSLSLFGVLTGFGLYMLVDALTNGPLWTRDYSLDGMQYGAKQVFADTIVPALERDPNVRFEVTSVWANGMDQLMSFFLTPEQQTRVEMQSVDYYETEKRPLESNTVLVMAPKEYEQARTDPKFKPVQVDQIIPYPDGRPGFYFARLAYADNVDAVFAAEQTERRKPITETIKLDDQMVQVAHPRFGRGQLSDVLDTNPDTLVNAAQNPMTFAFTFPSPRTLNGVQVNTATYADFTVTVQLYAPGGETPVTYANTYKNLPADPTVDFTFDRGPSQVSRAVVEVKQNQAPDTAMIHVRGIIFR